MRAASITWASGRGFGPGNGDFLGPVKWHRANRRVPFVAKKVEHLCTCDYMALCEMLLMRAASITRASGRELGPENRDFFGPCEMASCR
jgi:hypothetical protein